MTPAQAHIQDVLKHRHRVAKLLLTAARALTERAACHDDSKFSAAEMDAFIATRSRFAATPYGTPEYFALLAELKPALDHHYAENRHHPEHFENGIEGMDLMDLLEMVCDWMAASQRRPGDILELGKLYERFHIEDPLARIISNTVGNLIFL